MGFRVKGLGVTAMSAMMVEQLGLAMIPPFFLPSLKSAMASGFTLGGRIRLVV